MFTSILFLSDCMLWLSMGVMAEMAEVGTRGEVDRRRVTVGTVHIKTVEAVENRRMKSCIKCSGIEDTARRHRVESGGRKGRHIVQSIFHRSPNVHVVVRRLHLQNVEQRGGVDIEIVGLNRSRQCRRRSVLVLDSLSLRLGLGRVRNASSAISIGSRNFAGSCCCRCWTGLKLCSNPVKSALFSSPKTVRASQCS